MFGRKNKKNAEPVPSTGVQLAEEVFPLVTVPFLDRPRIMRLRRLSMNQAKAAIGDVALNWGEVEPGAGEHAMAVSEAVTLIDHMDKAARAVMVEPTYDEVVAEMDRVRPEGARLSALAQIDEIRKELDNFSSAEHPQVIELQAKADHIRAMEAFPLPEDTYGFLFSFAIGADGVDMRAYTEQSAMEAAALGERYGKRPSEIADIDSEERPYLAESYDRTSTLALANYREIQRNMKTGGVGAIFRG